MTLIQWAIKWGIPLEALDDFKQQLGMDDGSEPVVGKHGVPLISEAGAQTHVRCAAAERGMVLWRNNVGAMQDDTGRVVRYGLANESKAMNKRVKSSDLIGIRPIRIKPHHVGGILGQFLSREMKEPGWRYTGTDREVAQLRFMEIVLAHGGDAAFSTGELD
jgi:hypothetical protein